MLHKNYNCGQNSPGSHIQRALYELEPVVFSLHGHQETFEGEATVRFPQGLLEAVGDCDTEMDFEETRAISDLVAPLLQANIANGRSMKDVRLEFVKWARDGRRYQLTVEDNKIWLCMKERTGHKAFIDDASEAELSTGGSFWKSLLPV